MLEEALGYPLQDENRLKTIGTGGLLYLIFDITYYLIDSKFRGNIIAYLFLFFLILIGLCLAGYSYRVFRATAREEESVPAFTDLDILITQGLKLFGVTIAYLLPTIMLYTLSFITDGGSALVSLLLFWAGTLLGLVAWFLLPVAWTNVALTNQLGAALELRNVVNATLTGRYILAFLFIVVLGLIFNVIASIMLLLLIGVFVQFYVLVLLSFLVGNGCGPTLRDRQSENTSTE